MNSAATSLIRPLSWLFAGLLVIATILFLGLSFDVFVKPPDLPASNDLVQNLLGSIDFRNAIWPFDFWSNALFAAALFLLIPFARSLGSFAPSDDPRTSLFVWTLGAGGLLGVAAELIYVGAKQTTIDNAYCDCGYKAQEAISQFWAMNLIQGAQGWLLNGVGILAAIGVALTAVVFRGRLMPSLWAWLSFATSAVLLGSVVLPALHVGDPKIGSLLTALASGILLPAWAVWLGMKLGRSSSSKSADRPV